MPFHQIFVWVFTSFASQMCGITRKFVKIRTKMGNNRVGKKLIPGYLPVKGRFLRLLNVFFLLLAVRFYVIPKADRATSKL